jgi:AraC family transcriptional regulator
MPNQQLPNQQLPEWPVDLDRPPQVVRLGEGRHGTGALIEDWLLPDLWALHFYRYDAELEIGGTVTAVHPGYVSVVAPGVLMRYRFRGPSEHAYAHLRMRPGGQRIGALHQLRGDAGFVRSCWADALSAGVGDEQRRDAAFWAALWRLARPARPDHRRAGLPPAVSTAVRTIEDNLDRPLPVAEWPRPPVSRTTT